jgi:hypothetical protein
MLRSIAALVGGFAVLTVIIGVGVPVTSLALLPAGPSLPDQPPTITAGYLAANLGLSFIAAVVAGWVVATIAERYRVAHAVVLGLVLAAVGIVEASKGLEPGQPKWYGWVLAAMAPLGLTLGAFLRVRLGSRHTARALRAR